MQDRRGLNHDVGTGIERFEQPDRRYLVRLPRRYPDPRSKGDPSMNSSHAVHPPEPTHIPGTSKGEERALAGREPGRGVGRHYRTARDSTGINPQARQPIHPDMPNLPPA
jgi:hypothetical protein